VPASVPEVSAEEQQMALLLADLQRYGALPADDVRREVTTLTQTLAKQRTDANRVRLAMLYTLGRTSPQDDQRALQLLDNVAKSGPGSPAVKQLAAVLQTQISERVRAVKDEQQKADVAIQKLEALRNMERSLLRERVRGGGGSAGGSGGSSGGGGGSGGSAGGH
jgi:isochorismate hydrolase